MNGHEESGIVLLGFAAVGALALAVAVGFAVSDRAPWVASDAPMAEQPPAGGAPSRPSIWPLGAALGFGLLAVGAATIGTVQLAALLVLFVVGAGWLVQQWTEHHRYTPIFGGRLQERFLIPFGLPVGVLALVATILISLSRIFLALPDQGTRAVALGIAVLLLVSAFSVAASKRMARTALMFLCGFALAAAIGAGVAGVVHGERKFEKPKLVNHFVPAPGQAGPTTTTVAPTSTP
jgi:uncharacterized membrane protein YphA (DoxX/SURF4 family)